MRGGLVFLFIWLYVIVCVIIITSCTTPKPTVIDGDSYKIGSVEYRLACINAFEWNHPKGREATQALDYWLDHVTHIEHVKTGYYDRNIVFLWAGKTLVNAELYQTGLARFYWDYPCRYKNQILNRE